MTPNAETSLAGSAVIIRLTALWGLCECGLGGWMHALHLPLTGFFVGAASIVLIALIGYYAENKFCTVLQATATVVLIKAAVSPQSPLPAYIAVAFQGFTGACLFALLSYRAACMFVAIVTMLESAWQKLIIATVIFGKSLWQSFDAALASLFKEFHLADGFAYSTAFVIIYTGIYFIWAIIVGFWMMKLPGYLRQNAESYSAEIRKASMQHIEPPRQTFKKAGRWILPVVALLLFIFLWYQGRQKQAFFVILRTVAVIAAYMVLAGPMLRWYLKRQLKKNSSNTHLNAALQHLPALRKAAPLAWQLAGKEDNKIRKVQKFFILMIIIAIHPTDVLE